MKVESPWHQKADLRPSPLSATLSPDLLTLQSSFHVNYLPDILRTFKGLLEAGEIEEFEVENTIKPAVQLDGQLARENSRLILLKLLVGPLSKATICTFPLRNPWLRSTQNHFQLFINKLLKERASNIRFFYRLMIRNWLAWKNCLIQFHPVVFQFNLHPESHQIS